MQREEKNLEACVDTLLQRISEIKMSMQNLLRKMDLDPEIQWPSVLDSYALLSGQLNQLLKVLKNEKTPLLRNYVTLPLKLSQEPDESLMMTTEGRVKTFSHDLVPDLLRTKPDLDVEQKQNQLETRAASIPHDTAQKQINTLNKIVNNIVETVESSKNEWDSETSSRTNAPITHSTADFHSLLKAVYYGVGIKPGQPPPPGARAGGPPSQQTPSGRVSRLK
ncbi:hypothetical protein QYM36_017164 [Artemia franciscana]|uniref:Mediator of RNA polymerase II transcription subunit 8 n=1 Tax=Artemia franciscana TaxID=6661 RepID=A0AA88H7F5_ARTSF|nr:hypothetical protein QYM36_017164 [Artemia franciscana]